MSLLIDITKTVQGKPIAKVSSDIREARLNVCETCPHLIEGKRIRSCGGFLKGGVVMHRGKKMELCGCDIDDKTKYRDDGCPLEKW